MKETGRLILYDTSNYTDFPIGGQLTSVSNFLHFVADVHPAQTERTVLVGVTTDPSAVGKITSIERFGRSFAFLPVCAADTDLAHTAHSLRLSFAKGILRYGKMLRIRREDLHYIQTPEAVGPVKALYPGAHYCIFSHGSYANMERGFRFFRNNPVIRRGFRHYLHFVLRGADLIFTLDEDSRRAYKPYSHHLVSARNSIVLPPSYAQFDASSRTYRGRLLFVGRLSKDKGVDGIIRAAYLLQREQKNVHLFVIGEGEAGEDLRALDAALSEEYGTTSPVTFTGAVPPAQAAQRMEEADILIMNSAFEGVPMTILEALSHGLPVVTTNVGGIASAVHFREDAEETDGSPEEIAEAVKRIAADYSAYAESAHDHAAAFDYREVNRKIYEELAAVHQSIMRK
ncbi:MAG: glycosyltransferase family 4 protein [Lachnospiraceae bacterium]|nr:glycosyltransferase family 4 protein [Lachnospiraceae bacterium]